MLIRKTFRRGFSLVEILVALAILSLLIGLTMAAVQRARVAAERARCLNNLRQLGLALHGYHAKHDSLPAGWTGEQKSSLVHLGWHARILPQLEQDSLWQQIVAAYAADPDPTSPSFPAHATIRAVGIPNFFCRLDGRGPVVVPSGYKNPIGMTSYLGVSGIDTPGKKGCLFLNSAVKFTDIRDGTSNTLLIGERPPSHDLVFGWWYRGIGQDLDGGAEVVLGVQDLNYSPVMIPCPRGPYHFQPGKFTEPCDMFHFWSPHPGGAHFAFADGSVRFLRYDADPIMPALATRAGGETVTVPD